MSTIQPPTQFPSNFPKLLKGAIVVLAPTANSILSTIYFQYNPETLTRAVRAQVSGREGGDRTEAMRLKGAPIETIKLDVEFDSTGPLSQTEQNNALSLGIYPQLSALETLIYPTSERINDTMEQAGQGVLEIIPMEAPMTLLIWGTQRVLPVRLNAFTITEESYDVNLNPIRAKVSLNLRVLNYDDLPWKQRGARLFLSHHKAKERLATQGDLGYSAQRTGVNLQ
ncbi:MAG: hypothetical protein KME18_23115 [Phormidium tanganyikae FI6-MK23]|jgi:hypothetical protein|nr:hypothetical protein [Phormidium tanganyikae FI6-MK23]